MTRYNRPVFAACGALHAENQYVSAVADNRICDGSPH